MPDWTLFNLNISSGNYTLTLVDSFIVLLCAAAVSLVIALVYVFTHRKTGVSASMVITIFVIGPTVATIVLCVGSNMARAISIGGGLALIRFRNTVDDTKDIIFLLLSLAIGVACGIGFIGYAILAGIVICLLIVIANLVGFDRIGSKNMELRILVAEDMNYQDVFEPILKQYCRSFSLNRVKLTDYGTVLELRYNVRLKGNADQKQLIDDIRVKNGNLNISLVQGPLQ